MPFKLRFTPEAERNFHSLEQNRTLVKRLKAVRKALAWLEVNPRHPGLNTHKYGSLTAHGGEEVFEAYAENRTPATYRIFWHYGPGKDVITILAITPHP